MSNGNGHAVPTFFAIEVAGRVVHASDDHRLCAFAALGDAVSMLQQVAKEAPGARIVACQLTKIEVVEPMPQPDVSGVIVIR